MLPLFYRESLSMLASIIKAEERIRHQILYFLQEKTLIAGIEMLHSLCRLISWQFDHFTAKCCISKLGMSMYVSLGHAFLGAIFSITSNRITLSFPLTSG